MSPSLCELQKCKHIKKPQTFSKTITNFFSGRNTVWWTMKLEGLNKIWLACFECGWEKLPPITPITGKKNSLFQMLGSLPNEKKTTYLVNVPSGMFHLVGLLKQKQNMSTYSKIHTYIAFLLFGNYTCFLSLYLKLIYYMLIQSWRWRLHIPECKFKIKSIFSTGRELKKSKCSCPLVWKRKKNPITLH